MRDNAHAKIKSGLKGLGVHSDSSMLCGLYKLQENGEYKFVSILEFTKADEQSDKGNDGKELTSEGR